MTAPFKKAAIIGVGLIGGSLAMTLKRKQLAGTITGIGRGRANLDLAKKLGVVDEITHDIAEGVKGADLVITAVPVSMVADCIKKALPSLKPPCIITDVASVKGAIIREVEQFLPKGISFVPGHPIAGTEHSGVEAAFITLFEERLCVLTPTAKTPKEAVTAIKQMWEAAGSKVVFMKPDEHDKALAAISHLPHVIAYTLVNTVAGTLAGAEILKYSAGGFRDITRIASSPPEMWAGICAMNKDNIIGMIDEFQKRLEILKKRLSTNDKAAIHADFENAKRVRDSIPPNSGK